MAAPTQIGLSTYPATPERGITRHFAFIGAAGLLNSLIAALLFLRLPSTERPGLAALIVRAAIFVLAGALAGTLGSWYYWHRSESPFRANPPIPFRLFAVSAAAGWIFVPAVVLFSREDSPLTAAVAVVASVIFAASLRKVIPAEPKPHAAKYEPQALFAATLRQPPRQLQGYILSLGLYAAAYDLFNGWVLDASGMLAFCAFLFAWKLTMEPATPTDARRQLRRAVILLADVILLAFLVTLFALLYGVEHRAHLEAITRANAATQQRADDTQQQPHSAARATHTGIDGYQSIILWPMPAKNQLIPPVPVQTDLLAPGSTQPLVLSFNGQYWYFQPPSKRPSPTAIQVEGTPLVHDFASNNFAALNMEAHQTLSASIPIARCRQIQVEILNRDNHRGAISLALLLTDSTQPKNQLYLGQQLVVTSLPANFAVKSAPVAETVTFPIPQPAKLRRFDQITVMFFPDEANYEAAPKVAIQQFQIMPR